MRNPKRVLAATTLASEALVVFFATLVAYPLEDRQPIYLVAGGAVVLLCLLCAGMLRRPGGYVLGWTLQLIIISAGFIVPMMFGIGLIFAIIWFYSLRIGNRIERERAEFIAREDPPS